MKHKNTKERRAFLSEMRAIENRIGLALDEGITIKQIVNSGILERDRVLIAIDRNQTLSRLMRTNTRMFNRAAAIDSLLRSDSIFKRWGLDRRLELVVKVLKVIYGRV